MEHARRLERIRDAERAVEPAAFGLAVGVRAHEKRRRGRGAALAKDGAEAVDADGSEAGVREFRGEPASRGDVSGRERRPRHAAAVDAAVGCAERAERGERGEDAGRADEGGDGGNGGWC